MTRNQHVSAFVINIPRFGFLYNWLIILIIAILVKTFSNMWKTKSIELSLQCLSFWCFIPTEFRYCHGFQIIKFLNFQHPLLKSDLWFSDYEGGSKVAWNFSENPSVLEAPPVPMDLWSANQNNCTSKIIILRRRRYIKLFLWVTFKNEY